MKKLILLAIILRVLVSVFYFHPDIKTYYFQTSFLKNGVLNIYKYLIDNRNSLKHKEEFVYYPLTYIALGGYQVLISPVIGNKFDAWLDNASSIDIVKDPNVFLYLLIMKAPYILLDVTIGLLLLSISKKAFNFWLFNPFTIIIFYMFSNIDIMPIFFTVLSYLLIREKKYPLASVMLGFGAAFKVYPLLLVPFLFLNGETFKEKLLIGILPVVTFVIFIIPFWSQEFIYSALVSGLTTRIANQWFVIFYGILFFYVAFFRKNFSILNSWIIIFLIIFSFAHYHVQWLGWVAPFLIMLVATRKKITKSVLFLTIFAFLIPLLYNDRSMSWGLLRVYSLYFDLIPLPYVVLSKFIDPVAAQKILHIIFAVGSTSVALNLFKEKEEYD